METYEITCSSCGYHDVLQHGGTTRFETFSDINEDYSRYKIFLCNKEKKFISLDINDRTFQQNCPADNSQLEEVKSIPPITCPKCNTTLRILSVKI